MKQAKNHLRSYDRSNCAVFRKTNEQFGGLSNMASGFPIYINGIYVRTVEALYQACRYPLLPEVQAIIIDQRSPMTAKMKGKPYKDQTRNDWYRVRINIMRWCLRVKLVQHWDKFGSLLISTGNLLIVEESKKDIFWGAKSINYETLVGANILGRLLMELREEYYKFSSDKSYVVKPLEIPDFTLYGNPIVDLFREEFCINNTDIKIMNKASMEEPQQLNFLRNL